ncbi:hypothetical protein D3C84_1106380 [compost metagenome]
MEPDGPALLFNPLGHDQYPSGYRAQIAGPEYNGEQNWTEIEVQEQQDEGPDTQAVENGQC